MTWLHNPQGDYVLAAYGVAAAALLGLLAWVVLEGRRRRAAWLEIQSKRGAK
jgi:heme exporter protein CcmD